MFIRLALLQPNEAAEGLKVILQYQSDLKLRGIFAGFNQYFNKYWMNSIKPVGFCVGHLTHRTNNYVESFNAKMKRKIHVNPSAFSFLRERIFLCF